MHHYTQNRLPNKPRIVFDSKDMLWKCHDDYYIWGRGSTPTTAYNDWKTKESTRSRIPRRGVWNKPSTLRWYSEGCWVMRSYIGNKQIFGYDPTTDELILRG